MIKLQNNFTTVEQSKRLLDLGLPANSADMRYATKFDITPCVNIGFCTNADTSTPCWSVGRLIEIFEICTGLVWQNEVIDGYTKLDMLLEDFEDVENKYHPDFSKLEE